MKLSYAQCLEDFHLDLVLGDRAEGFYVDVGAGHPVADNVSYHFYLKGWRGIVVEPQEELGRLYGPLRPRDTLADYLVGDHEGEQTFYRVDRLHGFSTTVEDNAKGARQFGAEYVTHVLPIRPLHAVLDDVGSPKIDFLKVDVEGAEADVLRGMDFARHRPSVLCIEAIAPGVATPNFDKWEDIVIAAGYLFAFSDGLNRFYVPQEEEALLERFPKSPTPWNSVIHLGELGPVHQNTTHPDHALAERLIRGFLATVPRLSRAGLMALLTQSAGKSGLETGEALQHLLFGTADFPGTATGGNDVLDDDRVRAALGRIAAQYDGGTVSQD